MTDYKTYAWNKASDDKRLNAREYIIEDGTEPTDDRLKNFIWRSLGTEGQNKIKNFLDNREQNIVNFTERMQEKKKHKKTLKAVQHIEKTVKRRINKKLNYDKLQLLKYQGERTRRFLQHGRNIKKSTFSFQAPEGTSYNVGNALGEVIIPLPFDDLAEFENKLGEHAYETCIQLFDNGVHPLDYNILIETDFIDLVTEQIQPRTFNSRYYKASSRSQISETVQSIQSDLKAQMLVPKDKSSLTFHQGILMKLTYRGDESKKKTPKKPKKNKKFAGSYINHLTLPCFTGTIRRADMESYKKNKQYQHIFNIMNEDNLCFVYYLILVKYLCEEELCRPSKFDRQHLRPTVLPHETHKFLHYLPFIVYHTEALNKIAEHAIAMGFPNKTKEEALEYVRNNNVSYLMYDTLCKRLMKELSNHFPFDVNDSALIK
jgi:hypothetical protein